MNSSDFVLDHNGAVSQVRVARWADGVEVWRTVLKEQESKLFFDFRPSSDEFSEIFSQIGLYSSFSIFNGRISSAPTSREWDEMVPYLRWLLNELGIFERSKTPLSFNSSSVADPFVAWFRDFDAAIIEARILDKKLSWVKNAMKSIPGTTLSGVAKEIGVDADLVSQLEIFAESLLEPAWVYLDWPKLMGRGELHFGVRRSNAGMGGSVGRKSDPGGHYVGLVDRSQRQADSLVELISCLSQPGSVSLIFSSRDEADVWFDENEKKGTLAFSEEMEVFKILDEPLPYVLPNKAFSQWATGRISS